MQRQGRTPRAAEHDPMGDTELAAQAFDVGDQVIGRIVLQLPEWGRAAAAALVKNYDPPECRVEKPAMRRRRPGPRPAVQKEDRPPLPVARLLPIHRVRGVEPKSAGAVGLDRREQIAAAAHCRRVYGPRRRCDRASAHRPGIWRPWSAYAKIVAPWRGDLSRTGRWR